MDWTSHPSVHLNLLALPKSDRGDGGVDQHPSKHLSPQTIYLAVLSHDQRPPLNHSPSKPQNRRPITIQGMDAIIHDFPDSSSANDGNVVADDANGTQCSIYLSTSQCYPGLWRQFQAAPGRSQRSPEAAEIPPARHFPQLATVTHFSASQYFHWISEAPPSAIRLMVIGSRPWKTFNSIQVMGFLDS